MSNIGIFLLGVIFCCIVNLSIIGVCLCLRNDCEECKMENRELLEKHIRKREADYILDSAKYRKITAEEIAVLRYIIERYVK